MADKTIIFITGGNAGLGLATVQALAQSSKPYEIIIGSRSVDKANAAIADIKHDDSTSLSAVQVDLESDESIEAAAETLRAKFGRLDILLNNSGAAFDPEHAQGRMSMRDAWNKAWNINVTGTYILTYALVPLLLKSAAPRLVFITSGLSSLTEATGKGHPLNPNKVVPKGWPKPFLGTPAYRSSKTGLNMMYAEWYRVLQEDGVKVSCVSPGLLATGLGGQAEQLKKMGAIDPAIGADVVRGVIEGERDADVGKVARRTEIQPW